MNEPRFIQNNALYERNGHTQNKFGEIMKKTILILLAVLVSMSVFAKEVPLSREARMGALIQNKKTGDSLYLVCLARDIENKCTKMSFAINEATKDSLLGNAFASSELEDKINDALKTYASDKFFPYQFSLMIVVLGLSGSEFCLAVLPFVFAAETVLLPTEVVYTALGLGTHMKHIKLGKMDDTKKTNKVVRLSSKTFEKVVANILDNN